MDIGLVGSWISFFVIRYVIIGFSLLIFNAPVWALNWTIRPSLDLEQVYSDNIKLTDTDKKSALVTELSPGVVINGSSAISYFDFNYKMQNLYNAGGDSGIDINNQLKMDTLYEFVSNRVFMESSSSISQQNISNRRIQSDNISGDDSIATVSTFKLSPYWTPHFKGFADGEIRVTYDRVNSSGSESSLSKTNSLAQNIKLTSGHDFSSMSWFVTFNNSESSNSDSEDVNFQDSEVEVRYAIGRKFSIFARGGHSNNSFSSNSESNQNGVHYTLGGQWRPSLRLNVEAGIGNNSFITVDISPFRRLHWVTTFANNDIGLNTGNTWNSELNYRTRRSVWKLTYNEKTVTTQRLLLDQQVSTQFNTRLPTLTDEVFITKRADASFTFHTGKSDVIAKAYKTIRTFEQSDDDEEVTGFNVSWNWKFSRRTSALFKSNWQQTESEGIDAFVDERIDFSVGITRNILSRLNGKVEYRYVDQSSDDDLNTYSENRVTATLSLQY